MREFNQSIATGQPLRLFYRFRKCDESYAIFEAHGHPHIADGPQLSPSSPQSVCKGFFMMARPYPTRNAALLDSFLEHKIENERLMKRIADLKQEEIDDQQLQRQRQQQQSLRSEGLTSTSHGSSFGNDTPLSVSHGHGQTPISTPAESMPPPAKPVSALTRQNLDRMEASGSARVEGMREKMARFDGSTHEDTIEILTGLRYREGERSKGISTGDTSPALIRGDVGVPIPIDKESRQSSDKKKKQKIADEYVCTDCGTLDSPEWRKGPKGPKTLCNACGLRWAKFVVLFLFFSFLFFSFLFFSFSFSFSLSFSFLSFSFLSFSFLFFFFSFSFSSLFCFSGVLYPLSLRLTETRRKEKKRNASSANPSTGSIPPGSTIGGIS